MIGIIMMYYAFTSLSTVGFGDYNPRSDTERLVCAMILLFGVAIFSYIMGTFIEILGDYQHLNEDLEDGDKLTQFFGLLQKFNRDQPLDEDFRIKIEAYFDYKWSYDRNQAIDEPEELSLMEQLPDETVNKLYRDFLYVEFVGTFRDTFSIPKEVSGKNKIYFGWEDQAYREFMIALLRNLEPRFEPKWTILYQELEEISEIFFVSNGTMDIGYEINKQRKYVLRYTNRTLVGAYNCTYNKRTMFLYRCRSECKGYFIRKENWLEAISLNKEIGDYIKENVQNEYFDNILQKVMTAKKIHIDKLAQRKDFE